MKYLVVIEKSKGGFGAYVPDLPGVGVVGKTRKMVEKLITDSIELHLEDLKSRHTRILKPTADAIFVGTYL